MSALSRAEIRAKISAIPDDVLQCMVWKHAMGKAQIQELRIDRYNVYEVHQECKRCGGTKTQFLRVSTGEFARTTLYRKGPGVVSSGLGQLTRDVNGLLRLECINRGLWNDDAEEAWKNAA